MKKNRNNVVKIISIAILVLMMIFVFIDFYQENKNEKLLENSRIATAILIKKKARAVKSPKSGRFVYRVQGKEYEFSQPGDYLFMNIGDSVLIKYAVEDHSVARVIDKYYMRKYHYLRRD